MAKDSLTTPFKKQPSSSLTGEREKFLLTFVSISLAFVLFTLRGNLSSDTRLDKLARNSPKLEIALNNGRPTLLEFYADWCEVCRKMASSIESVEIKQQDKINIVLLNVDNPQWQGEIEKYHVNGIPHIELFNSDGYPVGRSLGARSNTEIDILTESLINNDPLPDLSGMGIMSHLFEKTQSALTSESL